MRIELADLADEIDAPAPRHRYVDDNHIGLRLLESFVAGGGVSSLGDDLDSGMFFDQPAIAFADDSVIVDQQHADAHAVRLPAARLGIRPEGRSRRSEGDPPQAFR